VISFDNYSSPLMACTMVRIDTKVGLWKKGEASEAWLEGADWVVDAIDNVPTKVS
jgi:tRNA A37 threonylcarbamoyladenosine dehydratase